MSMQENPAMEENKVDKIMEYIMNTPENTNPAILKGMLESLGSGGGGESDFSTAQVTLVNNQGGFTIPACMETPSAGSYANPPSAATVITAILYKGHCYISDMSIASVSGNIQHIEEAHLYDITGDCTITFPSIS